MQIFVRTLSGTTFPVDVLRDDRVGTLSQHVSTREGMPLTHQRLTYGGRVMRDDRLVSDYGIQSHATISMSLGLRGGGDSFRVRIQPRLQKETWSLYWKESMHTETECLGAFEFQTDSGTTVADLQRSIAKKMGWIPVGELLRLEGFKETWERCLCKGRELSEEKTLDECGVKEDSAITVVRKELIAEGWAIHVDDDDVSTSDESDL